MTGDAGYLFSMVTPLGFVVRSTKNYWVIISTIKHPAIADRLEEVKLTLAEPDTIRQSKSDSQVLLFYRAIGDSRWFCAVVKRLDSEGFLITAYPTENIKEGNEIWKK